MASLDVQLSAVANTVRKYMPAPGQPPLPFMETMAPIEAAGVIGDVYPWAAGVLEQAQVGNAALL